MHWIRFRFPLTVVLMVVPWLYLPGSGPTPQIERWLLSALALAAVVSWVPILKVPLRQQTLAQLAAWSLLLAALFSALLGATQFFGASANLEGWIGATPAGTAHANLLQRNQFATLVVLGLAALRWVAFAAPGNRLRYGPVVLAAVLLGASVAMSSSRIGLVELVFWCLCCWLFPWGGPTQSRWLPLVALLAYLGFAWASYWDMAGLGVEGGILARFQDHSPACSSRLVLWHNMLEVIAQKPWMGWGWGELGFAHFSTLYTGERFCDILDNAHNLPLQVAVVTGIPVALLLCLAAGIWLLRSRPWQEVQADRQFAWSVLLALGLHSLVEYPLWYGPFQLTLLLALAQLWDAAPRALEDDNSWSVRSLAPLLAGGLVVMVSYTAWDYHRIRQVYLVADQRSPAYRDDTLNKVRMSRLFQQQVQFAELTLVVLDADNAPERLARSLELLHYSAEPLVIESVLDAARLLDRQDILRWALPRYARAFPQEHARWVERQAFSKAAAGLAGHKGS